MKVLFKNTTKYSKENCNNFINFHTNRYWKKELIKYILIFLIFVYIFITNIIYKNWYFLLDLILIGTLIYFTSKQNQEKKRKERKKVKEYTFFFYKRYIKIKYRREYDRILYFNIKKIFETEKNFFLYTDDTHSLILDKDGFVVGNEKDFSEFIKKKCPFKYSNQTK